MKITVYRGNDRIGGCVTEYESNGWKLFVDCGEQLSGEPVFNNALEIDGLTCGDLSKSALLITHYHGNHIGKIADLAPELPIFVGGISNETAQELLDNLNPGNEESRSMAEHLGFVNTFVPGEQFSFGEFCIMPIIVDHYAFDAYAFCIDAENLKVFHTGNFCVHGFRSGKLPQLIEKYVGRVDYVVCEATNVNRPAATIKSEHELQKEFDSGHCDMASLDSLLDMLTPKAIISIHTDNPRHFANMFCEKWPVILLEDGESFSAIRDPGFDTTTAFVIAFQTPDNSYEVIDNPENLQWWTVDKKFLGEFLWWDDADSALHHVVYAPKRLLGYSIESDEDMAPFLYVVYNPDFTKHSEYTEGGHKPDDEGKQADCGYIPGQRVLAVIDDVLLPCEVIDPLTEDFLRKDFNQDGSRSEEDFQEYKSDLWDWDWDEVVVRPLVKIKTEFGEIVSDTTAKRIFIFPYKE